MVVEGRGTSGGGREAAQSHSAGAATTAASTGGSFRHRSDAAMSAVPRVPHPHAHVQLSSASVLSIFDVATRLTVAQSVVKSLKTGAIRIATADQLRWVMQVLSTALTLQSADHEVVVDAVNVYVEWLRNTQEGVTPTALLAQPETFVPEMITQLSFVLRNPPSLGSIDGHIHVCRRVILAMQLVPCFSEGVVVLNTLLWSLLDSFDAILGERGLSAPGQSLAENLGDELFKTLFDAWLTVSCKFYPDNALWSALHAKFIGWRKRQKAANWWAVVVRRLTRSVVELMAKGPSPPQPFEPALMAFDPVAAIPKEVLLHCWHSFLHLIDVDVSRDSDSRGGTHSGESDGSGASKHGMALTPVPLPFEQHYGVEQHLEIAQAIFDVVEELQTEAHNTTPPSATSVLGLVGPWLFTAASPSTPPSYQQSRAVAMAALCRIFTNPRDRTALPQIQVNRFIFLLHAALQVPTVADRVILESPYIFLAPRPGFLLTVLPFVKNCRRILCGTDATRTPPKLRAAAISILASLACYPNQFANVILPTSLSKPEGSHKLTFASIKQRIADILLQALNTETVDSNVEEIMYALQTIVLDDEARRAVQVVVQQAQEKQKEKEQEQQRQLQQDPPRFSPDSSPTSIRRSPRSRSQTLSGIRRPSTEALFKVPTTIKQSQPTTLKSTPLSAVTEQDSLNVEASESAQSVCEGDDEGVSDAPDDKGSLVTSESLPSSNQQEQRPQPLQSLPHHQTVATSRSKDVRAAAAAATAAKRYSIRNSSEDSPVKGTAHHDRTTTRSPRAASPLSRSKIHGSKPPPPPKLVVIRCADSILTKLEANPSLVVTIRALETLRIITRLHPLITRTDPEFPLVVLRRLSAIVQTKMELPNRRHTKDLHTAIVAGFQTITAWVLACKKQFTSDRPTLQAVLRALLTGLIGVTDPTRPSTQEAWSISKSTVTLLPLGHSGETPNPPGSPSQRVRHAALLLIETLFSLGTLGHMLRPGLQPTIQDSLNELEAMSAFLQGNIPASTVPRVFAQSNNTIITLMPASPSPSTSGGRNTLMVVVRDMFGRNAWTMTPAQPRSTGSSAAEQMSTRKGSKQVSTAMTTGSVPPTPTTTAPAPPTVPTKTAQAVFDSLFACNPPPSMGIKDFTKFLESGDGHANASSTSLSPLVVTPSSPQSTSLTDQFLHSPFSSKASQPMEYAVGIISAQAQAEKDATRTAEVTPAPMPETRQSSSAQPLELLTRQFISSFGFTSSMTQNSQAMTKFRELQITPELVQELEHLDRLTSHDIIDVVVVQLNEHGHLAQAKAAPPKGTETSSDKLLSRFERFQHNLADLPPLGFEATHCDTPRSTDRSSTSTVALQTRLRVRGYSPDSIPQHERAADSLAYDPLGVCRYSTETWVVVWAETGASRELFIQHYNADAQRKAPLIVAEPHAAEGLCTLETYIPRTGPWRSASLASSTSATHRSLSVVGCAISGKTVVSNSIVPHTISDIISNSFLRMSLVSTDYVLPHVSRQRVLHALSAPLERRETEQIISLATALNVTNASGEAGDKASPQLTAMLDNLIQLFHPPLPLIRHTTIPTASTA
eukprot:m.134016 g.134016  ORF g.134016 m.134016 type:complete len:1576 (-) comp13952_c0_seq2:3643-8370(-)